MRITPGLTLFAAGYFWWAYATTGQAGHLAAACICTVFDVLAYIGVPNAHARVREADDQ